MGESGSNKEHWKNCNWTSLEDFCEIDGRFKDIYLDLPLLLIIGYVTLYSFCFISNPFSFFFPFLSNCTWIKMERTSCVHVWFVFSKGDASFQHLDWNELSITVLWSFAKTTSFKILVYKSLTNCFYQFLTMPFIRSFQDVHFCFYWVLLNRLKVHSHFNF
jgi:hypothetical protein